MSAARIFPASLVAAAALLCISIGTTQAQTVVQAGIGIEIRFHGDTIWHFRDTTGTRTVFHGDTAIRTTFLHDRVRGTTTYVVVGDGVRTISVRDSAGNAVAFPQNQRPLPIALLTSDRETVVSAYRMSEANARIASMGGSRADREAPMSPATIQRYAISENTNIEQHLDTVRYIHGCAEAPPVDTTLYVMIGADSVRRVSPDARTFGPHMVAAVRADMARSLLSLAVRGGNPTAAGVPGPRKWPCDARH